MPVLDLLSSIDWWQLGWLFAGLFLVLMLAALLKVKTASAKGIDAGWHDRQHWENDAIVKGKLERQ